MDLTKENVLAQRARLSPEKRALLEKRLQGKFGSPEAETQETLPQIVPNLAERYQPFPLTDVQQAYWIGRHREFELGNVATHGYFEINIVNLDIKRFERAWQRLIDRHEMLRAIVQPDGQQRILPQVPSYSVQVLDLRSHPPDRVAAQLTAIRDRLSHQMLPADRYPLFDLQLVQFDDDRVRLCLSLDVLIGDAWSFEILLRELAELIDRPETVLPACDLSFRDYVLAELQLQKTQLYQRSQAYWQRRLPTLPPSPELPLVKSPSAIQQPRFVRRSTQLDPKTWERLKQRATTAGLTPSGIVLAAFAEILTLWSKSPRFTINLTLFNRLPLHPQVNEIVGDFTSLTLLAIDSAESNSFLTRSRRIQQQLWDDLDRRYFSGVQVLRELARLQKRPTAALMPVVFTSMLTQESLIRDSFNGTLSQDGLGKPASSLDLLGKLVYMLTQTPQVYLDHQVYETEGTLILNWDCVEELFPPSLLDDMFAAYSRFLHCLADDEAVWYAPQQLLPAHQWQQIGAINATESPILEDALLQTLFFDRVSLHAEQAAVITSDRTLSYRELRDRVCTLGDRLRALGAQPNELVAIVMEKGWEQVVATLGILTAGAAYVPIDPELPTERQWQLLAQSEVRWILTQSKLEATLTFPAGIDRLCVDRMESSDAPIPEVIQSPQDLAYVIYTSGSTGTPKGVAIHHQGAVNTILDINRRFQVNSGDRVFALSSLNFDLSVYDIFGTLAAGGAIVIPDAVRRKDPAHWLQLMQQHQVTIWDSVPALMQMLVEYLQGIGDRELGMRRAGDSELNSHNFPHPFADTLRLALLSGDWIPLSLPDRIRTLFPMVNVIGLGGATEASIWSILYPIRQVDPTWKSIPYGSPMLNQQFHVLNEALEPCPIWVPGQLYIGGIGLAKGYWRDEAKTAASFITHPRTGDRLYRTGDLGRYLPDGNIEFLGREDFQVKINGYRVELGEIETILEQYASIQTAIVSAIGTSREERRLVAYIIPDRESVAKSQDASSIQEWRSFLQSKLPDYMVPTAFLTIETLPLTANGKVDRKALPIPDLFQPSIATVYAPPKTELEQTLATIVQTVLQLEKVGIDDNFFDLGGNSLKLIQVHVQLRERFDRDISIVEMFRHPTVRSLSDYLSHSDAQTTPTHQQLSRADRRKALMQQRARRGNT
ncbi:non-ribosomal peptide synthetase [Cyanosarcina cf. burmensis CCALA 770]|nr:non-ribosomal peptide synthetase [Cyanosarcina cf. burmensis CCALA 770]